METILIHIYINKCRHHTVHHTFNHRDKQQSSGTMARIFFISLVTLNLLLSVHAGLPFFRNAASKVSPADGHQECAGSVNSHKLYDQLEKEVLKLFDGMDRYPIAMKKDGGNIEVRTTTEGTNVFTFSEAKKVDLTPDKFRGFLQNFADEFGKVNDMVMSTKVIERDPKHRREGVKSILKFPFPLTDRIMIHWKYLNMDRRPNEHMLFLSKQDNESLLAKYHTEKEKHKYVLGHTFLCAYWIRPIMEGGQVVGSNIRYLYNGDTGGAVPKKLQNFVGTKAAFESVHDLIAHVRKQQ